MWSAAVIKIDGYNVTIQYTEDSSGEDPVIEPVQLPKAPESTWLGDLTANRIVELSKRTAVLQSITEGPITPTDEILSAARITTASGVVSLGTVSEPPIVAPQI